MATKKTRSDFMKAVDQFDLDTVKAILEIFQRPEIIKAKEDLLALIDPEDKTALQRPASTDATALAANAAVPFNNVPALAESLIQILEARINPPEEQPLVSMQTILPPPAS